MIAATLTLPLLAPIELTLAEMRRRRGEDATRGLVPGLILPDRAPGWTPASTLISGEALGGMLRAAEQRWGGSAHAGAALAWKCYTYWLALPAVVGWATARRVPLLHPDDVLVRLSGSQPFLTMGLRRARVAVLPSDPLAATARDDGEGDVTVAASEADLREVLRRTLRDDHLDPLLAQIRSWVRLGQRTLLGSLASGVAHAVLRGVPGEAHVLRRTAGTLLSTLGVADLVELEPTPDGYAVQRRTCCLAFTLPTPKVCTGCCIRSS